MDRVLEEFGIDPTRIPSANFDDLNLAGHRLDPWPDSIAGLNRLKACHIIAPLSNGNITLLLNMAKRVGLPWDAILGAEVVRAYKPMPDAYLRTADILALVPRKSALWQLTTAILLLRANAGCGPRLSCDRQSTDRGRPAI